ncbi:MAG: 4Fe-4S binding protein [Fibrobacter sp.]|jgi:NADH-quinone oxidoreductase subunit F|nr:4Fe-4S binding protein [Fibrobacter sp.]
MEIEVLKQSRLAFAKRKEKSKKRIIICAGTGCVANGSMKVFDAIKAILAEKKLSADIVTDNHDHREHIDTAGSGCQGFCQMGPLVTIEPDGIMYVKVQTGDAREIVEETIEKGRIIDRLTYREPGSGISHPLRKDINFYRLQHRFALSLCGLIDPEDIDEYIYHDGYEAAARCFLEMSPEEICKIIKESGLRGRGGGGFLTGVKWELALAQKNPKKYIICNGDEGDPGAFMDRSVMEGNPHAVIEGMMIAARAIGADEGVVYVRAEYPLAVKRMRHAVSVATEKGILGKNALGSGQSFTITIMEGAGAFVCGEETALMSSVMGRRGMPTPKPPFPAEKGLRGKPTVINNVETLATVPRIILNGPEKYKEMGTAGSAGTKTFALTGHVANTGLIEVPFGTTLREIVFNIGGGVCGTDGTVDNSRLKVVQIGGPSGGTLTREHLDLPLDFDSLKRIGAMVGSGGLVVMNTDTCVVKNVAKYFMQFTQRESCGKCLPCREGTRQILALLDEIVQGRGTLQTITDLEELADAVRKAALCGLGKTAPNPVLSTLRYFRDEYEAHVVDKRCPAGQCEALTPPSIDPARCIGCGACLRKCPVNAITGEKKKPHQINVLTCVRCGTCAAVCKFQAITGVSA